MDKYGADIFSITVKNDITNHFSLLTSYGKTNLPKNQLNTLEIILNLLLIISNQNLILMQTEIHDV